MKKTLLLLIILFQSAICFAQNYQCLQSGVKHYFTNSNGYLRGIRIDSVKTFGDTIVYYPFHTPRGAYNPTSSIVLDTNGGSWLGKKVMQKSDGIFIFDSYWNDSVIIKTQANVGDSWVFYQDTSPLYYKATAVSIDTMSVLSSVDSVKTIMITAYDSSGIVASDPLDSFDIILSKNNGFVQVFDLYTFPYHKPDSVYRPGLDFFLDRSTLGYNYINVAGGNSPDTSITIFKLTDFINPNDQQLHNWNIGDIIEGYHQVASYPIGGGYTDYIMDTVSNKIISGHAINYSLSGTDYTCTFRPGLCYGSFSYYWDPCTLIINGGGYTFYDTVYSIADTSFIPEANLHLSNYVFYFPSDSSLCMISPEYVLTYADYSIEGEDPSPVYYKLGIGETHNSSFDDDCILFYTDGLVYTNIQGVSCGGIHHDLETKNINSGAIQIFPNPANDELTIKTNALSYTITLVNIMGQTIYTTHATKQEDTINTNNVPAGVYNIIITDEAGNRYNQKAVIVH